MKINEAFLKKKDQALSTASPSPSSQVSTAQKVLTMPQPYSGRAFSNPCTQGFNLAHRKKR